MTVADTMSYRSAAARTFSTSSFRIIPGIRSRVPACPQVMTTRRMQRTARSRPFGQACDRASHPPLRQEAGKNWDCLGLSFVRPSAKQGVKGQCGGVGEAGDLVDCDAQAGVVVGGLIPIVEKHAFERAGGTRSATIRRSASCIGSRSPGAITKCTAMPFNATIS